MSLPVETIQGVCVVHVPDAALLDLTSINQFRDELNSLIEQRSPQCLVMDLARVTRATSLALGVVVSACQQLQQSGGAGRVCNLSPDLREVFRFTEIEKLVPVSPTIDDAIAALAAES